MLRSLRIQNMAVVDQLQLEFESGLNALTGETGAGKSIITRAIGLLCGDRAQAELVRTDADEATVEGVFDGIDPGLFEECGVDPAPELLVRRVISRSGKGRIHLNGSPATAAVLARIGAGLIHVYGQHEQTLLLKSENHLELLDAFGNLVKERAAMAEAYGVYRESADRLRRLESDRELAQQKLDLLRFQTGELREAGVAVGEHEALRRERERQRHAEKLGRVYREGEEALYAGDQAVSSAVSRVLSQIEEASRIDPALGDAVETLRQARAQIDDVAGTLRRSAERIEHDPGRLEEIEERLALMGRLQRKYGCAPDELPARLETLERELGGLDSSAEGEAELRRRTDELARAAWVAARGLSAARHAVAKRLEKAMDKELRALGMAEGAFGATFTQSAREAGEDSAETLSPLGGDAVEFYLSANPGEAPKPLARIASGGELSRIMLALKTLTAGGGEAGTLIFDEVDAGIGGRVAEAVGRRLQSLGRDRQILCITHLPQIAALANHQFVVEKRVQAGRTRTSARPLEGDDRVRELARMLGGEGKESERYARQLMSSITANNPR